MIKNKLEVLELKHTWIAKIHQVAFKDHKKWALIKYQDHNSEYKIFLVWLKTYQLILIAITQITWLLKPNLKNKVKESRLSFQ